MNQSYTSEQMAQLLKRLFLLSAAVTVAAGCAGTSSVTYNSAISSVERPEDAADRYGEYTVTEKDTSYVYEDDLVRAAFAYSGGSVFMTVDNKTEQSIQIRVEQGAFVMPDGGSDRIILGDMSFANRNQEVQPITVPRGASSTATLIPQSRVSMGEYGPTVAPIFSPTFISALDSDTKKKQEVRDNVGKTFSLLLPIEIQGNVNEYTFNFEVVGARLEGSGPGSTDTTIGEYPSSN